MVQGGDFSQRGNASATAGQNHAHNAVAGYGIAGALQFGHGVDELPRGSCGEILLVVAGAQFHAGLVADDRIVAVIVGGLHRRDS